MIITTAAAYCLALNVYWEARGEEPDAQYMIAEVVMERAYTHGYPKDICDIVWEKGQFSWTHDGKSDKPKDIPAWLQAQLVANTVLLYGSEFNTGATHYATRDSHPYWAKDMQIVGMYGNHIFYREKDE
jgi:spore germination cell wall hydrolase CwlJ-like protein